MMTVEYLEEGARLIAQPEGRMEASDGEDLASAILERLPAGSAGGVTIDLERLDFINFGGIRALLRLARDLGDRGQQLDFVGGNDAVRYTLDQAGLDDFFPFTPPYVSSRGKTDEVQ